MKGVSDRLEISLFDTWYLRDAVLIRDGIPLLDLLNGAPTDVAGGQPRHKVEFRTLVYSHGVGGLSFSSLGTIDLRIFTDLERLPLTRARPWASGARVSCSVSNLFDTRQSVHDALGVTPIAFEPGYLDPPGSLLTLSARKVF